MPRRPASRPSRGEPERETERNWWPETPSSCAGPSPRATPPGGAPRPTRGSAQSWCATARSSARARPNRPAAPTPRSRPCGPPATAPAAPPSTPPSSRARTRGARRRARSRWPKPASPAWSWRCPIPTAWSPGRASPSSATAASPSSVGVGADDAARALAPYLLQRRLGRAYTVVKTAMSLDGRIAARDGSSRWITGAGVARRRPRAARRLAGRSSWARAPRWPTARASPPATWTPRWPASRCGCSSTPPAGSPPTARCSTPRSRPPWWSPPRPPPMVPNRRGWPRGPRS